MTLADWLKYENVIISTHTLTWSVTGQFNSTVYKNRISTHTLTWSVTTGYYEQFHTPYISTHTLTWSVTLSYTAHLLSFLHFNSHAHVERDYGGFCSFGGNYNFNSHAHVERDLMKYDTI